MHEIPPTHRVCRAVIHLHAVDLESKHRVGLLRELNMVALQELFAVLHPATEKKMLSLSTSCSDVVRGTLIVRICEFVHVLRALIF